MTEGTRTYKGLAVPLYGECEIKQGTAATDMITLTAITGASGDFLVCQTAGGGEVFVIGAAGELTAGSLVYAGTFSATKLKMGTAGSPTTAPTTGLSKGDMFLVWKSATAPVLGCCVSAATQLVQYIAAFDAGTLGIPS